MSAASSDVLGEVSGPAGRRAARELLGQQRCAGSRRLLATPSTEA